MTEQNDPTEPAIDPAAERLRQKMVRLMAVSIGIMFIGVMAVLVAVVYRTTGEEQSQGPGEGATIALPLPQGAEVAETSLDGDRIMVRVFTPDGEELLIFDRRDGRPINRYPLTRP